MPKLLIIDDEKPTLSMFRLFLNALGYDVLTAENGLEGMELFKKEAPPIVLTDIKMPGIDGLAVLKQIKKISPETEVIVITGHGDLELAKEAMDLHASGFIHKPIDRQALEDALNKANEKLASRSIG
ncbi:MAG: response regulator [Desulfobacteraceae bacterium]|nr:MAG: response regulator [Desulfobacteraceae bacterium]